LTPPWSFQNFTYVWTPTSWGANVDASAPDCGPSQPILIVEPSLPVLAAAVVAALAAAVVAADAAAVVAAPPAAVVAAAAAAVVAALLDELELSLPHAVVAMNSDAPQSTTPNRKPNLCRPAGTLPSAPAAPVFRRTLMPTFPLLQQAPHPRSREVRSL
jgi:hypothetical protein